MNISGFYESNKQTVRYVILTAVYIASVFTIYFRQQIGALPAGVGVLTDAVTATSVLFETSGAIIFAGGLARVAAISLEVSSMTTGSWLLWKTFKLAAPNKRLDYVKWSIETSIARRKFVQSKSAFITLSLTFTLAPFFLLSVKGALISILYLVRPE